jgi:HAD superfamily hydrolase (TIGR01509 family)
MSNNFEIPSQQGVLSDFDGTLVDTEEAKEKLFHQGVEKAQTETGLLYPNTEHHVRGESTTDPMIKWVEAAEDQATKAQRQQFLKIYLAHWNGEQETLYGNQENFKSFKGAQVLVKKLTPERSALVSSNPTARLKLALKTLNWESNFGTVIGYDHKKVTAKKPDPSSYRTASQELGLTPDQCTVIEDSFPGLKSGLDAGASQAFLIHRGTAEIDPRLQQFVAENSHRVQVIQSLEQINFQA